MREYVRLPNDCAIFGRVCPPRAHRIGQQRPVTIYRLVAENTLEEQIVALHARKRDLADGLLEGGEVSAKVDADALLKLLAGAAS